MANIIRIGGGASAGGYSFRYSGKDSSRNDDNENPVNMTTINQSGFTDVFSYASGIFTVLQDTELHYALKNYDYQNRGNCPANLYYNGQIIDTAAPNTNGEGQSVIKQGSMNVFAGDVIKVGYTTSWYHFASLSLSNSASGLDLTIYQS